MNNSERQQGQVLVLFALILVALLGMAALAIDVSGVQSEMRTERSIADAASLAGAQDTFRDGSTTVDNTEWTKARTHAMRTIIDQLVGPGASMPTCGGYASDIVNCQVPGTPYYASVAAPAPSCATGGCDANRSVQVTIRNPRHELSFARLFGQGSWNAAITSVAERNRGTNYTFVTLRPPDPRKKSDPSCDPDCDANDNDILLDGDKTVLTVHGDMGTNTNMNLTAGASVVVDPGSSVYRFDLYKGWSGNPPDKQLSATIPDPGYTYPTPPATSDTARNFGDELAARTSAATCTNEITNLMPASYKVFAADVTSGDAVCYKPGAYNMTTGFPPTKVKTMIFTPGVYFFNTGFSVGNNVRVIGGYAPNTAGVTFWFPRSCKPACTFAGNAADLVALNAGSAYDTGSGLPAKAAQNWDGAFVQTNGLNPRPITLMVEWDPACVVGPKDPPACQKNEGENGQLNLPGGGKLFAFGVQYAPSDNVAIKGGSGSDGYLGQIWAWTVKYTGGSNINLTGAANPEPGVLRLAIPCSPSAACTAPESTAAIP